MCNIKALYVQVVGKASPPPTPKWESSGSTFLASGLSLLHPLCDSSGLGHIFTCLGYLGLPPPAASVLPTDPQVQVLGLLLTNFCLFLLPNTKSQQLTWLCTTPNELTFAVCSRQKWHR